MTNDTTFEKIEAWLSGELPEAEARAFEADMASDALLKAEVERHRRGRQALERLGERSLQLDFARWRESLDDIPLPPAGNLPDELNPKGGRPKRPRLLWGGITLLILAGAVWFLVPRTKPEPGTDTQIKRETNPPAQPPSEPLVTNPPSQKPLEPSPQTPTAPDSRQLIAMADTRLSGFHSTILDQYKDRRGEEDGENPFFTAGLAAFQKNNVLEAKQNLLKIPASDPYFASAQEMLASIYFKEKNYAAAAESYQAFADQNADPIIDWRLTLFYLADYNNHKKAFWTKFNDIKNPAKKHRYVKNAQKLEIELKQSGFFQK